ncbi:hypothetical protein ACQ4PT_065720 [Festuca glaucescens]
MARAALLLLLFLTAVYQTPALAAAACEPKRCGNLTISPPFGVVSRGADENPCALMGFQVHCTGGVPYLGYYAPDYGLRILDIFYGNTSLRVSDVHKLGDFLFNGSGDGKPCHVPTANTASKIGFPFEVSKLNRNLVFYNCTKAPAPRTVRRAGLVETVCRNNNTFVRAGGSYDEPWEYGIEGCNATALTVRGPSAGEVNPGDYRELISDGFLLTWQQPPPAADAGSSSGKLAHSSS